MRVRSAVLAVVVVGCLAMATQAMASGAHIDRSFGVNGSLQLPTERSGTYALVDQAATGPKGGIYLLMTVYDCGGAECAPPYCHQPVCPPHYLMLRRLRRDGTPDPGYGGPDGRALATPEGADEAIAVDSRGRQVIATSLPDGIAVVRLLSSGGLDPTFGTDGRVSIPCDCGSSRVQINITSTDGVTLVYGAGSFESLRKRVVLARLTSAGHLDPRYGRSGVAAATFGGNEFFPRETLGLRGGDTVVGGSISTPYTGERPQKVFASVQRFDSRGRPDRAFAARVLRAVKSFRPPTWRGPDEVRALVPRPKGELDLFGTTGWRGGFVLRVHANGSVDRRFGHRGIRVFGDAITTGAADRAGHLLAVGWSEESELEAFWLGRGSRFRPPPVRFQRLLFPESTTVMMQGARPLLFDQRAGECRSYEDCGPNPILIRLRPWGR